MLENELSARNLPPLFTDGEDSGNWALWRRKTLDVFQNQVYGITPDPPGGVTASVCSEDPLAWAGKALHRQVSLSFQTPRGLFAFPLDLVLPRKKGKIPLIVYISFERYPGSRYGPVEEIVDNGYGLASFCYQDVSSDSGMMDKMAYMFDRPDGDGALWGKIGMWAYAGSRVMDYVLTLDNVDEGQIACLGHSRLGKTSLWCGAQDERFAAVLVNESGCSGAAITRGKQGETIRDICSSFPFWFCENYKAYMGREYELPLDQHHLLASVAPRLLYVASANEDLWCDPGSEYLACAAADEAYRKLGLKGFYHEDRYPSAGEYFHEGEIGYHLRGGSHFLSRYDFGMFMKYLNRHMA